jgi:spore germination protein GerM
VASLLALVVAVILSPGSPPAPPAPNCDLPAADAARSTVLVYLMKQDVGRRFPAERRNYVASRRRISPAKTRTPLRAALHRLLEAPTRRERRHGCISTFSNDAHVLRDVSIVEGQAIVNFDRRAFFREKLGIVSASYAGAVFLSQLELTILQFANVESIRFEFDGDCEDFGWFMQVGECVILRR